MERGRDLIKEAIELNPDAHFGREKYQLMAMEWILNPPPKESRGRDDYQPDLLPPFVKVRSGSRKEAAEAARGVAGLVSLGNAWESVDAFNTLAQILTAWSKPRLAEFAGLRAQELVLKGNSSLWPETASTALAAMLTFQSYGDSPEIGSPDYKQLRADADKWQQHRTDYMMQLLKAGRHPDTDDDFWDDYDELPEPSLGAKKMSTQLKVGLAVGGLIAVPLVGLFCLKLAARMVRRERMS